MAGETPDPTPRPPLRGVLLDVDGTLLDSNDAHARAWVDVLGAEGFPCDLAVVRPLIGMGGDKIVPFLTHLPAKSERAEAIGARRSARFKATYFPTVRPFPAVRALIERLRADALAIVVATSAKKSELDELLGRAEVGDLVDARVTADDAEHSKPDPDIVRAALAKAELAPYEAILLGDTPYDVEAAAQAGVDAVALRCGGFTDGQLAGAVAVYRDPADLLAAYDASPFARARGRG
jgi:HAD superfamily hydrolase (TIGR01509 family)